MKTNDLAGADIAFECLRCAEGAGRQIYDDCPNLSLRDIADPHNSGVCASPALRKLREQSENVYENKGPCFS
jgi:hypothetical protein